MAAKRRYLADQSDSSGGRTTETYSMIIAQKTTIDMYNFRDPPGVFPSDMMKHVTKTPR